MPYIKQEARDRIEGPGTSIIKRLAARIETAGELNYAVTRLIHEVVGEEWGESYQSYDEIVGALECLKLELYRRKIAEYEDIKIKENGDV